MAPVEFTARKHAHKNCTSRTETREGERSSGDWRPLKRCSGVRICAQSFDSARRPHQLSPQEARISAHIGISLLPNPSLSSSLARSSGTTEKFYMEAAPGFRAGDKTRRQLFYGAMRRVILRTATGLVINTNLSIDSLRKI